MICQSSVTCRPSLRCLLNVHEISCTADAKRESNEFSRWVCCHCDFKGFALPTGRAIVDLRESRSKQTGFAAIVCCRGGSSLHEDDVSGFGRSKEFRLWRGKRKPLTVLFKRFFGQRSYKLHACLNLINPGKLLWQKITIASL